VRGCRRIVIDEGRAIACFRRTVAGASRKYPGQVLPANVADDPGCKDDGGERRVERKNRDERSRSKRPERGMLERPLRDAPRRGEHDRHHCRLDAVEDSRHQRHVAVGDVDPGQGDQDEH
jgi:hypothetical protein